MENSFKGADNRYYNLSPLTLGDLQAFTRFVQYRDWQQFQDLKEQLPQDEFTAESRRLLQEANKRRFNESSPEVQAMFASLEGSVYLLYLSLKRNHPTITYAEVADVVTIPVAQEASEKLAVISGLVANLPPKKKQASH